MKISSSNPSEIELEFTKVVLDLRDEIQKKLTLNKIIDIKNNIHEDNPMILFKLENKDGDKHELMLKFIQRIEE